MKLIEIVNDLKFEYLSKYKEDEINKYLDHRDSEKFELNWLKNLDELNELDLNENEKTEINEVRGLIFKKVYSLTSNEELSGYLSDDFEIIGINIIKNNNNDYAINLLESYKLNQLPK